MPTFNDLEMKVIRWAESRKIIPNSTPLAQYRKCCEEIDELGQALDRNDVDLIKDGVGDVLVCLINLCALQGIGMVECLSLAYEEIKDRKGTMNSAGIFVKEGQ